MQMVAGQIEPTDSGSGAPLLAVSATFTAEPLGQTLGFWTNELGWDYGIRFAPYNQVFQQLLDPASLLARNRPGVNIVLLRPEDWVRFQDATPGVVESIQENARHLVACARSAAKSFGAPLLLSICPASPTSQADPLRAAAVKQAEECLLTGLGGVPSIHLLSQAELNTLYPIAQPHDPHSDELGHVPYTAAFFAALGTLLIRKIHAIRTPPYKVIALDCDETLWRGICGEDGPEAVALDASSKALQEFMLAQHRAGMLLCLASRNNEEDVLETLGRHPEFPLQPEHIAARRINWEAKSANLAELAARMDLGLDSFIFVDDNPEECAEVQSGRPEVLVLPLPRPPREVSAFLEHVWAFDRLQVTGEDKQRTAFYQQQAERSRVEKHAATLSEFISSLNLDVRISTLNPDQIPRVSQLTMRVNQMNCSSIRRTEGEVAALRHEGKECLVLEVADRFGSYGLTGVAIFEARAGALWVDSFLLSCRVLGRGVEHRLLARLGAIAAERGFASVDIPFIQAQRNRPAQLFLESVHGGCREAREHTGLFRFPASYAQAVAYDPENGPLPARVKESDGEPRRRTIDYVRIATSLRDVDQILSSVRGRPEPPVAAVPPAEAPRTLTEERLAALWAEMLSQPAVGLHDNFFDMGGHSLLAVELLSRVKQMFQVEISLEVVYGAAFTVAELASAIELEQIRQVGPGEYAAILEELEQLSDEEVRALLAEEEGSQSV